MTDLGEVLSMARRASGVTQEELSNKAGVTQAALSRYENGLRQPDDEVIEQLAEALGVTSRFLRHAGRARGAMAVDAHMRRRATAEATVWKRLEAQLNMYRMHASMMFEEIAIHAERRIPTFDPIDVLPADAARLVRMEWGVPIGPVRSLMAWLESAGCLVIERNFGTTRVDALSQWVDGHPVIFLNSEAPTDRKRLTLAHELGHLVLHSQYVVEDVEGQANEFAAEFLMPIEVIRPRLRNLRADRLVDLKREWGVSMAALVEHAYRTGHMTPDARTKMFKMLGARGWRVREPISDELPPERPTLSHAIADTFAAKGLTPGDVAFIAGFRTEHDNDLFVGQGLRAVR